MAAGLIGGVHSGQLATGRLHPTRPHRPGNLTRHTATRSARSCAATGSPGVRPTRPPPGWCGARSRAGPDRAGRGPSGHAWLQIAKVLRGRPVTGAAPARQSSVRTLPARLASPGCWSAAASSARRGRPGSARPCRSRGRRRANPSSRLASTVSAPRVLQLVGLELVHQADAPALVPADVEHDAPALVRRPQRIAACELAPQSQRREPKHVPGQALGVHSDQHVLRRRRVAVDQGDVLDAVDRRLR